MDHKTIHVLKKLLPKLVIDSSLEAECLLVANNLIKLLESLLKLGLLRRHILVGSEVRQMELQMQIEQIQKVI